MRDPLPAPMAPCRDELLANIWRRIDPLDAGLRDMVARADAALARAEAKLAQADAHIEAVEAGYAELRDAFAAAEARAARLEAYVRDRAGNECGFIDRRGRDCGECYTCEARALLAALAAASTGVKDG